MDSWAVIIYFVLALYLVASALGQTQSQSSDEKETPTSNHFQLIVSPSEVIRDVTRNIKINCLFTKKGTSPLRKVAKVRLLKKSPSGWKQLAETRWYNMSVKKRRRMNPGANLALLKFTWDEATDEIFGIYRCDLVGLDSRMKKMSESTPEVEVGNVDLTDLLIQMRYEHNREVNNLKQKIVHLEQILLSQTEEVQSLKEDLVNIETNVTSRFTNLSVDDIQGAASDSDLLHLKSEINSADTKIQDTQEDVSKTRQEISFLNSSLGDQLEQVRTDIQSVDSSITDRFATLPVTGITGVASKEELRSISKNVALLNGDIFSVGENLSSLAESMKNDINNMEKDLLLLEKNFNSMFINMSGVYKNNTQNQEDITNLRKDVKYLKGQTATLEKSAASQQSKGVDLRHQLDQTNANVQALKTQTESFQGMFYSLNGSISSNSGIISEFQKELALTKGTCDSLNGDLSSLSGQVSSIHSHSGKIENDVVSLRKLIDTVKVDTSFLDGKLSTFAEDISDLQEAMSSKDAELVTIKAGIALNKYVSSASKKAIKDLKEQVSTLNGNMADIQGDVTNLQGDREEADGKLTSLQSNLKSVQSKYKSLSTGLKTLTSQVDASGKSISSLKLRVNGLSNRQTSFERSLASNRPRNLMRRIDRRRTYNRARGSG